MGEDAYFGKRGAAKLTMAMNMAIFLAMSTSVNIAEFKDRLSEFLDLVEKGGEVIVCRRNVPLVKLESIRKHGPVKKTASAIGCMKGSVLIHGDLTEPAIPESDWEMLR